MTDTKTTSEIAFEDNHKPKIGQIGLQNSNKKKTPKPQDIYLLFNKIKFIFVEWCSNSTSHMAYQT
jgi:hypothetical protein